MWTVFQTVFRSRNCNWNFVINQENASRISLTAFFRIYIQGSGRRSSSIYVVEHQIIKKVTISKSLFNIR